MGWRERADQLPVQLGVARRRATPTDVTRHRAPLHRRPLLGVAEGGDGAPDGVGQRHGIHGREHEAGGDAVADGCRVGVDHGVGQSTDASDDGQRPVAQSVQLREPTRFEARRHDDGVGPRLHAVRQRLVVADHRGHRLGSRRGGGQEAGLEVGGAGAEHGQLGADREQVGQRRQEQIEALLLGEPAHHAEQGRARVDGEPELALQRRLVGRLPLHLPGTVGGDEMGVVPRVPHVVVDPVHDARHLARLGAQHPVEPHALRNGEDLAGVGGAHRRDVVGVAHASLQEADLLVVLHAVDVVGPDRQAHAREPHRGEQALEGEVVDREQRGWHVAVGPRDHAEAQVRGNEPGLPVVGVHQIGPPTTERQASGGDERSHP